MIRGVLLSVMALLSGCEVDADRVIVAEPATFQAEIETVSLRAFPRELFLSGNVVAPRRLEIASRLTGFVEAVEVDEGEAITTGQVLARLDDARIAAEIARAEAEIAQAKAELGDAQADVSRLSVLTRTQVVPEDQLRDAQVREQKARAALAGAKATLREKQADIAYTVLRSPENALVVQRLVDAGDLANANVNTTFFVLESQGIREIDIHVPVMAFDSVSLGAGLAVTLDGSREVTATVQRIVPVADYPTRRIKVTLRLPEAVQPPTGSHARVRLPLGTDEATAVSRAAVTQRAGIEGAFLVDAAGVARFRSLELGRRHGGYQMVLSGLRPGDQVVLDPDATLHDGQRVSSQ